MRKLVTITILLWAVAAAIFAPLAAIDQPSKPSDIDRLLFFPTKYPRGNWTPDDLNYEDVYFSADDHTRLHGWFCPVEDPVATILLAHGNAGNLTSRTILLRYLQSQVRASVFIFDYRGYGRSDGSPSIDGVLRDARAARTKLCELAEIEDSEMLLMGASLGGAIMVQLAAESSPRALILQSTFSSLKDVAEVHYPNQAWMVPPTTLDSATQIAKFRGSLFLSHGDRDSTIPFSSGQKLFQAASEPKTMVTIAGAGHNNWLTDDYLRQLDQFIQQTSTLRK